MLPELSEIRRRRKALNITQQDLAQLTNLSRSTITKIELEKLEPSYSKAKKIFEELDRLERQMTGKNRLENITLGDIHATPVEYAPSSQSIYDTWIRMVETAFSQYPVESNGHIVGSITERAITKAIFENEGKNVGEQSISKIMEDPFPVLSVSTPLGLVGSLIMHTGTVLTQKDSNIIGIVTRSDIGKAIEILKL